MDDLASQVADRMKKKTAESGLKQVDLCRMTGLSRNSMSNYFWESIFQIQYLCTKLLLRYKQMSNGFLQDTIQRYRTIPRHCPQMRTMFCSTITTGHY